MGALLFLTACSLDLVEDSPGNSALSGAQPFPYSAEIRGMEDLAELRPLAEASARTFQLQDRGAPSEAGLERRAEQDISRIRQVLRSEGYYDAAITTALETGPEGEPRMVFDVVPGARYDFGAIMMQAQGDDPRLPAEDAMRAAAGLNSGEPARGENVVEAEAAVVSFLKRQGFPDAAFVERKAVAHRADAILDVTSVFAPGPYATFGALNIDADSSLDADYIRGLVPWKQGAPWNQKKVDDFQASLRSTGLFSSVSVKPEPAAEWTARDMNLSIDNARQRSVGGSLRYDSDQGPGVRVFWRHRNLLGRAEDFRAEADVSLREQKLSVGITRPRHPGRKWTSHESLVLRRLDEDAFEEKSATLRSGMDVAAGNGWVLGGSLEGSAALTTTDFVDETSYLVGLPLYARRDRTNDPLDATSGYRLLLNTGPFIGLNNGEPIKFGVVGGAGSVYIPLIGDNRLVLALRTKVSSILSQELGQVPVNKRLFAGGGASVRGFEFQSISPVNNQGDNIGGRFLNENSAEFRLRLGESFGVVAFADTGVVEEEPFPTFDEQLNVGVGGGFRYYSPVGPIRFDIAFPLDRRAGDSLFEFYISLGQAF